MGGRRRNAAAVGAFLILSAIGAARIVATYQVFNQTTDEPAHVATGMEWLQRGSYTFEPLHPPLARVAVAVGPYLSGRRLDGQGNLWKQGNDVLMDPGRYQHVLALARLGVLPFFLIATFVVWYWARRRYGEWAALIATFFFTTCPVVLAHSGLATTDMAVTAMFVAAVALYVSMLERPTYLAATALGIAGAFAILAKFSALLFLPAVGLGLAIWRRLLVRKTNCARGATPTFVWRRAVLLSLLMTSLTVWAGYRFSVGSISQPSSRPHAFVDRVLGTTGSLHELAYTIEESPIVPAPAFFKGLEAAHRHEASGHVGYLLGQIRQTGWWYYYPVAIAVKTPLAFLIVVVASMAYLLAMSWRQRDWILGAPAVAAASILLAALPNHINIGLRHILPIYPLLAVTAGVGVYQIWASARSWQVTAVMLALVAWQVTASIRAHPDYLADFNELANRHPERVLIDSDLDWGQDLSRLSRVLRERGIEDLSIAYAGSPLLDLTQFGLPAFHVLRPYEHADGWVAVSLLRLKAGGLGFPADGYSWLDAYQPVIRVGRSIWLYRLPPTRQTASIPAMP